MKPEDFQLLSDLLKRRSGLLLSPEKGYLLESRLTPLARKRGLEGLDELVAEIRNKRDEALLHDVTEAMTTNESFFFRDTTPFDLFKNQVLPLLKENRKTNKRVRIWCAACSTGQEPYSLAMILKEQEAAWPGWQFEIIGTDLSQQVLDKARQGTYSQFEVQRGLPIQLLMKYFTQSGEVWQLTENIRNMVTYREFNLLDPFDALGKFDVIYCRNVLIYFDQPTKTQILDRMRTLMPVDGTLFLGAAETVLGITDALKPVRGQRGMYIPSDAPAIMQPAAAASA